MYKSGDRVIIKKLDKTLKGTIYDGGGTSGIYQVVLDGNRSCGLFPCEKIGETILYEVYINLIKLDVQWYRDNRLNKLLE